MKVSYYPGCSLHGTAREYDESTKAVCEMLDIELCELEDWNCCGAIAITQVDPFLAIALSGRNLVIAEREGRDLIVPCAACYHRLKVAERELGTNPIAEIPYQGEIKIKHLLDFLSQDSNPNRIRERIKRPLTGLKPVCYYGCLALRPPRITGARDFEDPQQMDELVTMLGAESYPWSYKGDCCGAALAIPRPDIVARLTRRLLEKAQEAGADCIVTCCPLCQANLDTRQGEFGKDYYLPIFFFTELIGLALGHSKAPDWWQRHLVDPRKLLTSRGLI